MNTTKKGLPYVDKRVKKSSKPLTGQHKLNVAESMKLKQGGYGPLQALEQRLKEIVPKMLG